MIIINSSTRQFTIPGADLVFGVEDDSNSEIKEFQCPRYVGNNLDLAGCFIRMNYRNANGEIDSYLVKDAAVNGDNVVFTWELTPKVTMYKGQLVFVMCVVGPDTKVKWHTTLGKGQVLEGLEPDSAVVEEGTADVVAQLIAMVEAQTAAVEAEGANQIAAVKAAVAAAEAAAVAEIEAKGVNTRNSIPADYAALSEAVAAAAPGIVCEAAGSVVAMNDASDMPFRGMRIFGRSTQDGTPTPEAPVEIVSVESPAVRVTGKNLIPFPYTEMSKTKNGVTFTVNNDGSIHIKGTAEKATNLAIFSGSLPLSGAFTLSGVTNDRTPSTHYMQPYVDDVFQASLTNGGQTYEINGNLTAITLYVKSGETLDCVVRPQFEIGSAATEYEAPAMQQTSELTHTLPGIPVTSGGNYTDSDGQQWICDEVDLERGVYVQRTKKFVLSELKKETWYTWGVNYSADGITGFYHFFGDDVTNVIVLSNIGKYSIKAWGGVGVGVGVGTSADGDYFIVSLPNEMLADTSTNAKAIESFLAFIADTEAVILAAVAPVETPLSETEIAAYRALHSNKPNTTILNDGDAHMVVKYTADTKLYIDNKIAALVAQA